MDYSGKIRGAIYAAAIGDGYGAITEFVRFNDIWLEWPPAGPDAPIGNPILVTDDTQMALAVGKSLMQCHPNEWNATHFGQTLEKEYVNWYFDPKNNRAPGMNCMSVCEKLAAGAPWLSATSRDSKGCGANMRVMPVGLMRSKGLGYEEIAQYAQLQSAITHAHPTALAAADITAICLAMILDSVPDNRLLSELDVYARSQREVYHTDFLYNVWEGPGYASETEFIGRGWDEVIAVLANVKESLKTFKDYTDPCKYTGEGWIAEEAFATSLLCYLLDSESVERVLKRAVVTCGDSDSLACIAGAFVGARNGIEMVPLDWISRIEYREELNELCSFFGD